MNLFERISQKLRGRPFKMYDVDAFHNEEKTFKIYDDEMEIVLAEKAKREEFDRKLSNACRLNNEGIALEKDGDIAGAISKYEENILPDTRFSLYPYRRLCVLYRRAEDYDNEIRVIQTCLARPECQKMKDTPSAKEYFFFEDRLAKAIKYRDKKNQSK